MLRFRALALSRMDGDVWQWDLCAVYYAHSDDFAGNWHPPTRTESAPGGSVTTRPGGGGRIDGETVGHAERAATAPGYEKCGAGELVELFGAGSVTWMFTEGRTP